LRWFHSGAIRLFQLLRKIIIVRPQHSARSAKLAEDTHMAKHKSGTMDITEQKKTYHGFLKVTEGAIIVVILILVFLTVYVA
jgi:hypothetical protein